MILHFRIQCFKADFLVPISTYFGEKKNSLLHLGFIIYKNVIRCKNLKVRRTFFFCFFIIETLKTRAERIYTFVLKNCQLVPPLFTVRNDFDENN